MIFQKIKPTTSSRRQLLRLNNFDVNLSKKPLLKSLVIGKKNVTGKNHSGKITVFHKGGGVKKNYRKIDFYRTSKNEGIICSLEYDPNRHCFIASVFNFLNKSFQYIIAPKNLNVGDIVKSGPEIETTLGNSTTLSGISIGTAIHLISTKKNKKSQISRSAGTFSTITEKLKDQAVVELSSGKKKKIPLECFASIGEVSNGLHFLTRLSKAGQSRWLNKRPTVRGVAMNPIDHPHGGGEGKKSGESRTPWGKPTKKGSSITQQFKNKYEQKKI